jgi:hypothetical protein
VDNREEERYGGRISIMGTEKCIRDRFSTDEKFVRLITN